MVLAEAHAVLQHLGTARAAGEWDEPLTVAVQRALAELYLLNPWDDVDGRCGPRTLTAWSLFCAQANGPAGGAASAPPHMVPPLDEASARRLADASRERERLIGSPCVPLQPDFEFRRNDRIGNRARSAVAIIAEARNAGMTRPQIAYVLATAEHESANFATLEEYDPGHRYENRADLGNNRPGDGPRFKGRGYVQLTRRRNYTTYAARCGLRLVEFPVILMNWPALSVHVLVDGMKRGAYTGVPLDRYINAHRQDFRQARRVVNGLDCADRIAGLARHWLEQLD